MATKQMALRRAGTCAACSTELEAGTRAQWDPVAKAVTCLPCIETPHGDGEPAAPDPLAASADAVVDGDAVAVGVAGSVVEPSPQEPEPAREPEPIAVGTAGASARKEFERRQAKREAKIEETWGSGRLGRFVKAVSDDPQSTKAWAKGAAGEERLAKEFAKRLGDRALVLHDRKVPGTRGNIDHLVIGPSGIWVVDAKKYKGKVEKRDVGGMFKTDIRLFVDGRDRSKAVTGMGWQVQALHKALEGCPVPDVPCHLALCFVLAEWPLLFAKPFRLGDVWVTRPAWLADQVLGGPVLDAEAIEAVARHLASRLPANG